MDLLEIVGIYKVPQNEDPSCFLRLYNPRWPPELNVYMKPIWSHNFVLDRDHINFNFFFVPEVTPKRVKVLEITGNYRKLPKITQTAENDLNQSIILYWIEIVTSIFLFCTVSDPNKGKGTGNYQKLPKTTYIGPIYEINTPFLFVTQRE